MHFWHNSALLFHSMYSINFRHFLPKMSQILSRVEIYINRPVLQILREDKYFRKLVEKVETLQVFFEKFSWKVKSWLKYLSSQGNLVGFYKGGKVISRETKFIEKVSIWTGKVLTNTGKNNCTLKIHFRMPIFKTEVHK